MERITSRQNPLITRLRRLGAEKKTRRAQGVFLCEGTKLVGEALRDGVKLLEEALRWEAPLTTVVVTEGVQVPELPQGVRAIQVPQDVMETISPMNTPQGALFLARLPETTLPERLEGRRYLVLDGVQDPGNVGTVWRTADAFGAAGLFLLPGCAEPFAPKTVRATMGACFRLPVWEGTLEDLTGLLARSAVSLYAAALRDDTEDIRSVPLGSAAVVIGSEGRGVSQPVLDACRATLKIPMRDRCESLNAAVAASVVLWEGWR